MRKYLALTLVLFAWAVHAQQKPPPHEYEPQIPVETIRQPQPPVPLEPCAPLEHCMPPSH